MLWPAGPDLPGPGQDGLARHACWLFPFCWGTPWPGMPGAGGTGAQARGAWTAAASPAGPWTAGPAREGPAERERRPGPAGCPGSAALHLPAVAGPGSSSGWVRGFVAVRKRPAAPAVLRQPADSAHSAAGPQGPARCRARATVRPRPGRPPWTGARWTRAAPGAATGRARRPAGRPAAGQGAACWGLGAGGLGARLRRTLVLRHHGRGVDRGRGRMCRPTGLAGQQAVTEPCPLGGRGPRIRPAVGLLAAQRVGPATSWV
jgi:hypothetical protein